MTREIDKDALKELVEGALEGLKDGLDESEKLAPEKAVELLKERARGAVYLLQAIKRSI